MLKRYLAYTTGFTMLAAAAVAQTTAPAPNPPATAPAPTPGVVTQSAKPAEHNVAMPGKWRASKLMGVDIYGADNTKVGDVTEVLLDKSGKIEAVTVGVGGFLGIGTKDVAIPFEQVTWSDQPMATTSAAPAAGTAPATGTTGTTTAMPPATATAPKAPMMYPDHGKISMTKDQLTQAPAVSYSN